MKKLICITIILLINTLPIVNCFAGYTAEQSAVILQKIKPSMVFASVNVDAPLKISDSEDSETIKTVPKASQVELLKDKTRGWYYVLEAETNEVGWIEGKYLDIPEEAPVNETLLTDFEIETYINILGFSSKTENFVFVDVDRQKVYILSGEKGNWKHIKTITCSTGKNESPTIRGLFEITDRGVWFYSERLKSGAQYWVRFHETYLFHTLAMDKNKNVIDETLGKKSSNGCVRMSIEDAKWFYNNVKDKTGVFII